MGQGAIDGLTHVTTPCCCLCLPPLGLWPALLVLVTPSPPVPTPSRQGVYILHKPSPRAVVCMGGGGGSLPQGVWREGNCLVCYCVFLFCLSWAGMGVEEGVHLLSSTPFPPPQTAYLVLPCPSEG